MTTNLTAQTFALDSFEGPLDFLLHLVQKSEVDIYEVAISQITQQFLQVIEQAEQQDVDLGAEFLGVAATLLLIKSRTLLPQHEQEEEQDEDPDPRFEVIHQLLEYCKFKELGKSLSAREAENTGFYFRGLDQETKAMRIPSGVDHLSVDDLAQIFQESLQRAASRKGGNIEEEEWRVIDKIRSIKKNLLLEGSLSVTQLFCPSKSRNELIVIFLAVLELMKLGVIDVIRNSESGAIEMHPQQQETTE